ncbi:TIGR00730 family Rossman fold protein [Anaerocolumna sp. MB42-C2]|uniref:LOG family protein n=1 Tax=Anaerocolumna sp. MB42-C2 TaxID=3070997 RepID=UPI0027DF7608|nr:TIGR00730 family Rossman fold protein [Anaerocolumna sp. MB42-C2]WMJ87527.1 TIGR00730 family Rossman fold protein [Anaerocolumna sp. MB42-C2]
MNRICVYSGSNLGNKPEYKKCALQLGEILAQNKIELVYGGSNVGLMGKLSNQVLKNNGQATGVMPKGLFPKEIVNTNLTRFIEVVDMHERKKKMADLSDGFIALPGGVGTYEELFEILSWAQLRIHSKPVGILNVAHFFDPLIDMIVKAIQEGFMNQSNEKLFLVDTDPNSLLDKMKAYSPPNLGIKWRELQEK